MMISEDEQYKFVSEHCRWCSQMMTDTFNMFIRLATAIIGGSIYLGLQPAAHRNSLATLSDAIVILSAGVACLLVAEYSRARKGYRQQVSKLGGKDIPAPKRNPYLLEVTMGFAMVVVALMFCRFNPLASNSQSRTSPLILAVVGYAALAAIYWIAITNPELVNLAVQSGTSMSRRVVGRMRNRRR